MSVDWTSGHPCFVDNVDEVTFSGAEALKRGQKVYEWHRRCSAGRRRCLTN